MKYKIKPCDCLPCSLKEFWINGIAADIDDFGTVVFGEGSCMDSECSAEFKPYEDQEHIVEACKKYYITESEYYEVIEGLKDTLYIDGCGWCS